MRETITINFDGSDYSALGASVVGNYVAGYQTGSRLTTGNGSTMLDCRFYEFGTFRVNEYEFGRAVAWLLPRGRAIVGLSLGNGMLFRGELVDIVGYRGESVEFELRLESESIAEYWAQIDYDDSLAFDDCDSDDCDSDDCDSDDCE